jgi:YaiO family outer membrane protein
MTDPKRRAAREISAPWRGIRVRAMRFAGSASIAFWLLNGFAPPASAGDAPVPSSVGNPSLSAIAGYAPQSEVLVSGDAYDFTSPRSSMGTWAGEQFQFRSWDGPDTIGLGIANRVDANTPRMTAGSEAVLDDYYDWSKAFSTYAAIGIGDAPFANGTAYLESDFRMLASRRLLLGLGGGETHISGNRSDQYLSIGPTYYWPGVDASLRFIPTYGPRQRTSTALLAAVTAGELGRATTTMVVQSGVENPVVGEGLLPTLPGVNSFDFQLDYKRWISARGGLSAGLGIAHLTDVNPSALVYVQRGVNLGIFEDFGQR